ncbi:hypothetical protein [Actinosynnema sp.]|uniref:hypothetical protein n=1 Tax=Actinosynnema sp. TaxID=1872144 RepID=UPI003F869102
MGNDWDWTLHVGRTPEVIAGLFDLAVGAGLRIGHPEDGLISAFRADDSGEFDRLDRDDLVAALASGTYHSCTPWPAEEEVWFDVRESQSSWSIKRSRFTPGPAPPPHRALDRGGRAVRGEFRDRRGRVVGRAGVAGARW